MDVPSAFSSIHEVPRSMHRYTIHCMDTPHCGPRLADLVIRPNKCSCPCIINAISQSEHVLCDGDLIFEVAGKMQLFSNSSELLIISCSQKNFMIISQMVQELS